MGYKNRPIFSTIVELESRDGSIFLKMCDFATSHSLTNEVSSLHSI